MRINEKSENFEKLKDNNDDTSNNYDVEGEEDSKLDFDFDPVIKSLERNEAPEEGVGQDEEAFDTRFDPVIPSLEGNEGSEKKSELTDSFMDSEFDPVVKSLEPIIEEMPPKEYFDEEAPSENNFDDKGEDFLVEGSEQDIWFGSQRELNYLFNKYLEYKKAGFTEEEIRREKMPESEKMYQEMLKKEQKEREVRREKEQPEEEEDKWPGSQLEINYMVEQIERIEHEARTPEEALNMIAKAERNCQEMVRELEKQREAEKKHKEWVDHQLETMDHSDEVEEDYKEENVLKEGDQEETDYLIDKITEKIDKSELNSKLSDEEIKSNVEEMDKALTIDSINYDLDQIKKDYRRFLEEKSHLSDAEREALEKEEFVKELSRIPNDQSYNEFKDSEEQNNTIIEQQVEQEQVLVQQLKAQEVEVDSTLEQEKEKSKEENEQEQKDDISEESQEDVYQKPEIQMEEDEIIEIQLEEQELAMEMKEKEEEIVDEKNLKTIREGEKERKILKVKTHEEQDNIITQEQNKQKEESIIELETIEDECEELIEELGVTTIKEEKDKIKEKDVEEREEGLTEELLQERYHQETGRRSIYAGRKTKGFCEWLGQQQIDRECTEVDADQEQVKEVEIQRDEAQLKEEDIKQEKESEVSLETLEEQAKTDWKLIFKDWINELASLMLNPYLTKLLKDFIKDFRKFEALERLYNKDIRKRLTNKENVELFFINLKLFNLDFLYRRLVEDILTFKRTYDRIHPYEVSQLKEKFLTHLSKKYRSIIKEIESQELQINKDLQKQLHNSNKQFKSQQYKIEDLLTKSLDISSKMKEKVNYIIEKIYELIPKLELGKEQIDKLINKIIEVSKFFFQKLNRNELSIHKNSKLMTISSSIIYSSLISEAELPDFSFRDISEISGIGRETIRQYYNKYFKSYFYRSDFLFEVYSFRDINKLMSLFIFNELRRDNERSNKDLFSLIKDMTEKDKFPETLSQKDRNSIKEMFHKYPETFEKYFNDMIEIVKLLAFMSRNHKLLRANLVIKPLVSHLESKGINLEQKTETLYKDVREIYDFLKNHHKDYFPERLSRAFEEELSEQEYKLYLNRYRQIIGYRLKLFIIKSLIRNESKVKCPECKKLGLIINTDLSRLNALEFHHTTDKKNAIFTSVDLYDLYTKYQNDPYFLTKILEIIKSEKVQLLCRNHHMMMDDYYFDYFKAFINYKDLFSLKAEEIHILIRIIVDNFRLTKNLSKARKRSIRMRIKNRIKKKYLIETIFGNRCVICGEFNTEDHIRTFNFCHIDPRRKTCQASDLFNTYSCSEIANILEKERGIYICSNCHTVLDMDYYDIIEDIYDSEEIIKKVKNDYHRVKNRVEKVSEVSLRNIKDPLTKNKIFAIRENVIIYFNAIYELSQKGIIITNKTISKYTGTDYSGVKTFFLRRRDFLKRYIDFDIGRPTTYKLTLKGVNLVSLINYFQRYFQTLELNECVDCKFRRENECIATKTDECLYIKSGTHLPFDLDE